MIKVMFSSVAALAAMVILMLVFEVYIFKSSLVGAASKACSRSNFSAPSDNLQPNSGANCSKPRAGIAHAFDELVDRAYEMALRSRSSGQAGNQTETTATAASLPSARKPEKTKSNNKDKELSTEKKEKEFLCQDGAYAGNSNKLLSMARGLKWAHSKGLNYAMLNNKAWYHSWLEPHPSIKIVSENETINCVFNISGEKAYYYNFNDQRMGGNPYLPEIGKYFLPRQDIRERAERYVRELYGERPYVSVHRRAIMACLSRASRQKNVGGGRKENCTAEIMTKQCSMDFDFVQRNYNPTNMTVVLFSDGGNETTDSTFPIIDNHVFFEGMWMMVLSKVHVAVPASTVDLVVNHWRFSMGKPDIHPHVCYNDFHDNYVLEPDHFVLKATALNGRRGELLAMRPSQSKQASL